MQDPAGIKTRLHFVIEHQINAPENLLFRGIESGLKGRPKIGFYFD